MITFEYCNILNIYFNIWYLSIFYVYIFINFMIKKYQDVRSYGHKFRHFSIYEEILTFLRTNKVHSVSSRGSVVKRIFIDKKKTINAISIYMYDQYSPNLKKKNLEHYRTLIFTILIEALLLIKTVLLCLLDGEG